jgi:hypothetical protein
MASEEPVTYKIHSMVRSVHTRLQRQQAAKHHRFVTRLAGGAITVRRARPATVTEAQLKRHLGAVQQAVREGKVQVRTPTGQVVDIFGDKFHLESETPAVSPPKPSPPQDSVANDKTYEAGVGESMGAFPDTPGHMDDVPVPSVNVELPSSDEDEEDEDLEEEGGEG